MYLWKHIETAHEKEFCWYNLYLNTPKYKKKQENLNEERNSDRHNEELNVAFILGACAEWESISFEDIGVQGAKPRVTQSGW